MAGRGKASWYQIVWLGRDLVPACQSLFGEGRERSTPTTEAGSFRSLVAAMSINNEKPWRGSRQWIIRADDGPFQHKTTWCATWLRMRTWAARQLRVITHDCAAHVVTRKHVHLGLRHHQEEDAPAEVWVLLRVD